MNNTQDQRDTTEQLREKIVEILSRYVLFSDNEDPDNFPPVDLLLALLSQELSHVEKKKDEEWREKFSIKVDEKIDCPLHVCCSDCYVGAVNHRVDALLKVGG